MNDTASDVTGANEDAESCAHRGAFEELGVKIKIDKTIKEHTYTRDSGKEMTIVMYLCHIVDGNPTIRRQNEMEELDWMALDEFYDKFTVKAIAKR